MNAMRGLCTGSHTGLAMAIDQKRALDDFRVADKVIAETSDAASSARKGREELATLLGHAIEETDCVAHQLNLSVQAALLGVADILKKVH